MAFRSACATIPVNGCYVYLKAAFAEAVEQRLVTENPTKTLTLPHTRERETYTVPFEVT